jgi:hypothetical protein
MLGVLDAFSWAVTYCDPNQFPVARDEQAAMRERWPELASDPLFPHLVARQDEDPAALTDDQRLQVYRDWKMIRAVSFQRFGDTLRFEARLALPPAGELESRHVTGLVRSDGTIQLLSDVVELNLGCPI